MCRGLQQGSNKNNPKEDSCRGRRNRASNDHHDHDHVSSTARNSTCVGCELCGAKATLYCQADDAYLCQKCDRWVHGANFLALRHIRCLLCNTCQGFTQRYLIGASMEVVLPTLVASSNQQQQQQHCSSPTNDDDEKQEEASESASLKLPFLFL